jgi:hypothetical protein
VAILTTIKKALKQYPRLSSFLEDDGRISGKYNSFLNDPNMCNPFSTALYELVLLTNHYHPAVKKLCNEILELKTPIDRGISLYKFKTDHDFCCFKTSGFEVYPHVVQLKPVKRLDGPCFIYKSEFLQQLESCQ